MSSFYQLPSLKMLATFEAAARNASFKAGAEELNVTAGAVSHQIKALEEDLGVALFKRGHRTVELTSEGWMLFEALSRGFIEFSRSLKALRGASRLQNVSIGATTAVSSLWLTPRLAKFWQAHGDVTISQEVHDRPFHRPIQQDLVIEYTTQPPNDAHGMLFRDRLLPLCSPDYEGRDVAEIEDLAQAALIHLDAKETNWTSWANWFSGLGHSGAINARHRVNNYAIALQLAQDGNGVVLGWKSLVQPLIKSGNLIPLTKLESEAPGAFYLVQGSGAESDATRVFKQWLMDESNIS